MMDHVQRTQRSTLSLPNLGWLFCRTLLSLTPHCGGAPSTESIERRGYARTHRSGKERFPTLERRLSRQALLLREMHLCNTRMGQQVLGVAPENLLPHLGLEGVQGIKIFHPTLWGDKGIV